MATEAGSACAGISALFLAALFIFHKSKVAAEAGNACAGTSALFRQHFFISRKSKMAVTVANAKYILEGEGLQWCGLGARRAARVEVTRKGVKKGLKDKGKG